LTFLFRILSASVGGLSRFDIVVSLDC